MPSHADVKEVSEQLDVSFGVSKELLTLAGGDKDIVVKSSSESNGLDECKARVINARFEKIEKG